LRPLITIATLAVSFVLSAAGSVHGQQQPALPEQRSPFSQIAHDFTSWLTHVTGTGAHHHAPAASAPLPRPRPAELTSATATLNKQPAEMAPAPLAAEKQWSEVAPTSAPTSKKKSPAPVLIND